MLAKNVVPKLTCLSSYLNGEELFKEAEEIKRLIKESIFVPERQREGNEIRTEVYEVLGQKTIGEIIDDKYKFLVNDSNRNQTYEVILKLINFINNKEYSIGTTLKDEEIKIPIYKSVFWNGGTGSFIYVLKAEWNIAKKVRDEETNEKKEALNTLYYVGETNNIYRRFAQHRYLFRKQFYGDSNDANFIDITNAVEDNIINDIDHDGAKVIRAEAELAKKAGSTISFELVYIEELKEDLSPIENEYKRKLREKEVFFEYHHNHRNYENIKVRGSNWSKVVLNSETLRNRADYKKVVENIEEEANLNIANPPEHLKLALGHSIVVDEDLQTRLKYDNNIEAIVGDQKYMADIFLGTPQALSFENLKESGNEIRKEIVNTYIKKYSWASLDQILYELVNIAERENRALDFYIADSRDSLKIYLDEILSDEEINRIIEGEFAKLSWGGIPNEIKNCSQLVFRRIINNVWFMKQFSQDKNNAYEYLIKPGENGKFTESLIFKQLELNCESDIEAFKDVLEKINNINDMKQIFPQEVVFYHAKMPIKTRHDAYAVSALEYFGDSDQNNIEFFRDNIQNFTQVDLVGKYKNKNEILGYYIDELYNKYFNQDGNLRETYSGELNKAFNEDFQRIKDRKPPLGIPLSPEKKEEKEPTTIEEMKKKKKEMEQRMVELVEEINGDIKSKLNEMAEEEWESLPEWEKNELNKEKFIEEIISEGIVLSPGRLSFEELEYHSYLLDEQILEKIQEYKVERSRRDELTRRLRKLTEDIFRSYNLI
jgi:hypothetical protein